jgi:hypothetical protein
LKSHIALYIFMKFGREVMPFKRALIW